MLIRSNSHRFSRASRLVLLISTFSIAACAQSGPTVDDFKRAMDKAQQVQFKALGTSGVRTVLFQSVQAGKSASPGAYPFLVSMIVHECEKGSPPNHYYGRTVVGTMADERYVLVADEFGGWLVQGRLTPDLNETTFTNNTAEGTCAVPVNSLQGTRAPAGGPSGGGAPVMQPATATSNMAAALGDYKCWANGQARLLLNFTIQAKNEYRDHNGATGSYLVSSNGRVDFMGGSLDGFLPNGYYAVYQTPGGRPTVSFKNPGGSEVTFCQKQ